jgi:hypothetical protein
MTEIGSIFGLPEPPQTATNFRSALYAIYQWAKPETIWFPSYYCPGVVRNYQNCKRYGVWFKDGNMSCETVNYGPRDLIVVVNYFGFRNHLVWQGIPKGPVTVEDMSMSFYMDPHHRADFWVYNFRKFFPLPDGAVIHSRNKINLGINREPPERWWAVNLAAMALRDWGEPRSLWYEVSKAGKRYVPSGPYRMSDYSMKNMGIIHDEEAKRKRGCVYRSYLHHGLKSMMGPRCDASFPLGFPIQTPKAKKLSESLAEHGIFAPVMWEGDSIVMLPCDSRWEKDAEFVANTVRSLDG